MIDGVTKKHFIYSLNVDTGAMNPGWPVDVNATAMYNGILFSSLVQEDRGALALVNGIVYVPYSGYFGDCGSYHGWVVGVDINNPVNVGAWATTAAKAVSGDIAALPATAPTCLSSRVTPPAQEACGAVEKRSFVCRPDHSGAVSPQITGRRQIGSVSITATQILVVSAPCSSTCLEQILPARTRDRKGWQRVFA